MAENFATGFARGLSQGMQLAEQRRQQALQEKRQAEQDAWTKQVQDRQVKAWDSADQFKASNAAIVNQQGVDNAAIQQENQQATADNAVLAQYGNNLQAVQKGTAPPSTLGIDAQQAKQIPADATQQIAAAKKDDKKPMVSDYMVQIQLAKNALASGQGDMGSVIKAKNEAIAGMTKELIKGIGSSLTVDDLNKKYYDNFDNGHHLEKRKDGIYSVDEASGNAILVQAPDGRPASLLDIKQDLLTAHVSDPEKMAELGIKFQTQALERNKLAETMRHNKAGEANDAKAADTKLAIAEAKAAGGGQKETDLMNRVKLGVDQLALAYGVKLDALGQILNKDAIKDIAGYRKATAEMERRVRAGEEPLAIVDELAGQGARMQEEKKAGIKTGGSVISPAAAGTGGASYPKPWLTGGK